MLIRFAAATLVASVALAIATAIALVIPGVTLQQLAPLLALWCVAPCVWGLWALLAPRTWVPQRLPLWGMMLGVLAGLMAMFVLNLPLRIFALAASSGARTLGILIVALFYYLVWIIVRSVCKMLSRFG